MLPELVITAGIGNVADLERQGDAPGFNRLGSSDQMVMTPPQPPSPPPPPLPSTVPQSMPTLTFVVSNGEPLAPPEGTRKALEAVGSFVEELPTASPKKGHLSVSGSPHEQCRVCQQDKQEVLMHLGCQCRGGLAKAHQSCIDTWFRSRGSNKCEICQHPAMKVPTPEPPPTTAFSWIFKVPGKLLDLEG